MENELTARVSELKSRLHGRWASCLRECGVNESFLSGRNGPCPKCGGRDRFQYTDKFGSGNFHCRGCGPGDGFQLIQNALGLSFSEALKALERCAGTAVSLSSATNKEGCGERMKKLMTSIWEETLAVSVGDPVHKYLCNRGLGDAATTAAVRFHPSLGYYQRSNEGKSELLGSFPAMLALVTDPSGHRVTLHRTYLANGSKAPVPEAKKLLSAGIRGASIRLHQATDEVAIAEGIETALAVHLATAKPCWAAISARNMEQVVLPQSIRRVRIYADNDATSKFDGQASAFALARRLRQEDATRDVEVFVPRQAGADWADVWLNSGPRLKAA